MGEYRPMMLLIAISLLSHGSKALLVTSLHDLRQRVIGDTVVITVCCDSKSLTSHVLKTGA
jgi:hypothetical protein